MRRLLLTRMAPSENRRDLEEIDRQLDEAVRFCKSSGLSPTEVTECAKPIFDWVNGKKKRKTFRTLFKVALLIALVAVIWKSEICYRWLSIVCKLLQLKLLPYWDWTGLHEINCLISNRYYEEESEITDDDCEWSHQYPDAHRLKNLSHDNMTNNYILRDLPVIVTDATEGWLASEKFSFSYLQQIYLEEEVYDDCFSCEFETSAHTSGMRDFLENINDYNNFNTHWFNCRFHCMKSFRKYYQRPYFIPPMVGPSERNFVIVGKASRDLKAVLTSQTFPSFEQMTWISQIRGQLHVTLKSECAGVRNIEEILNAGETLTFNNKIWWMSYKATGPGESIALGSTGSWDE